MEDSVDENTQNIVLSVFSLRGLAIRQSVSQLAPHSSGVKLKPLSSPSWLALSLFHWWWHAMRRDCSGQTDGLKTSLLLHCSASHFTPPRYLARMKSNQVLFFVCSLISKPPKRPFIFFTFFFVLFLHLIFLAKGTFKCGWGICDAKATKLLTIDGMWE